MALTINATANNSGVTVTITNIGTGTDTTPFNLYVDFGLASQQIIAGTTGWVGGTPQTFLWNAFTPSNTRVGRIYISLLNNDLELLSNEVNTIVSGGTAKINATADYTTGVTVTISGFGSGSNTNTFNLVIDEGLATEQTKNGLTGWDSNPTKTIPWSEFTPSGVNGRVGGETITLDLTDTTTLLTGQASTTLSGGGPPGVNCFVASSQLLTPIGYKSAGDIKTGDLLMTADGRKVPIKAFTFTVKTDKTSAPYLIPKNSLARNVPATDMRLSPWHAISLGNGLWQKPQSAAELNPGSVTQYDVGKNVQYYHFEAPNYFTDNFICEGTVVESFSSKQLIGKERPYTWSAKYQAYTRHKGNSKKSVA